MLLLLLFSICLVCSFFLSIRQYEDVADKDDLMGVEDTAKKDILNHSLPI